MYKISCIAVVDCDGIFEWLNVGILGLADWDLFYIDSPQSKLKSGHHPFFKPNIPFFHYSNIPLVLVICTTLSRPQAWYNPPISGSLGMILLYTTIFDPVLFVNFIIIYCWKILGVVVVFYTQNFWWKGKSIKFNMLLIDLRAVSMLLL